MKKVVTAGTLVLVGIALGYLLFGRHRPADSTSKVICQPGNSRTEPVASPESLTTEATLPPSRPVTAPVVQQSEPEAIVPPEPSPRDDNPQNPEALPPDNTAWANERIMGRILNADATEQARLRAQFEQEILQRLSTGARIEITPDEAAKLSGVFLQALLEFCQQWHPVLKEGLQAPGPARDRLSVLNAVDPDAMLLLYAIPSKQADISTIIGDDRYDRLLSSVNAEFLRWYRDLTNRVERSNQGIQATR